MMDAARRQRTAKHRRYTGCLPSLYSLQTPPSPAKHHLPSNVTMYSDGTVACVASMHQRAILLCLSLQPVQPDAGSPFLWRNGRPPTSVRAKPAPAA